MSIQNLQPKALWRNFYQLTQIPRPSKKEEQIIQFVKHFGESLKLETIVDDTGNVIIRKPATQGMENRKGVVLQSHLDMVCQKNSDVNFDFDNDPIQAYVDGEWVKAKGTTLGADNGIGVATLLTVLQSNDIKHGPLECLFTIDEETGMTGAFGLKPGVLKGDILLNLDSEDEGEVFIGCAGGINTEALLTYKDEEVPGNAKGFKISVTGLKGGHSGTDIHLGRGNANKIMNRILWQGINDYALRLASINGGSLRNAIPRESFAVVVIPNDQAGSFVHYVHEFEETVRNELKTVEPNLKIKISETELPESVMNEVVQNALIRAVYACQNGVIEMSREVAGVVGVVETSTNLAKVKSGNGKIEVLTLQRSLVDSLKEDISNAIRSVFVLAGAHVEQSGDYPGWKPDPDSEILTVAKEVHAKLFGKEPEVKVVHAGLECGLIGGVYPNLDMLSFGPTIRNPHSPDEMVHIPAVARFWQYLVEVLENISKK